MTTISLQDLHKSFGETEVIHGIDMEIEDGEFIVIVGPSGCGKSTLLRMVAGLEGVTSGEIRIDGQRVNELEPMDRNIAMVFQNYALYPHMSVFDNMAYGLKIARKKKAEIKEKVGEVARLLQLEDLLDRKPRQLSGGQRQRVAMGRAIVRQPALFLFDEPLSNLDAKLRVQMRLEIKALQRQLGITSLYVTHDQVEAMTLADRMIVLNQGVAEQIGAPLEVYEEPATRFVGGFIGSPPMNFIAAGQCRPEGLRALLSTAEALPSGLIIGVRPEALESTQEGDHLFTGVVKFTEALGAETLIHLLLNDGEMVTLRQAGGLPLPAAGSNCHATCAPRAVALFQASGERLKLG